LILADLRLRETLREQSIRDPLTGLFNRRFLQESLDKELQRAKRKQRSLSLIFIDLDHFKHFNDVFGHEADDYVLQSMADIFRTHFRAEDIICRYGGEEFAVILAEASTEDAFKRAEALRLAIRDLKLVHRGKLLDPVTLSIGIAGFPGHGQTPPGVAGYRRHKPLSIQGQRPRLRYRGRRSNLISWRRLTCFAHEIFPKTKCDVPQFLMPLFLDHPPSLLAAAPRH
jgi:diguanylate cyclase (GGDEF)-like protein